MVMAVFSVFGQHISKDEQNLLKKWVVVKMQVQHESVLQKDSSFVPPKKMVYNFVSAEKCILDVVDKRSGTKATYSKYWGYYPEDRSIEFFDYKPSSSMTSGPYKILELTENTFNMYCCVDGKCYTYFMKPAEQ